MQQIVEQFNRAEYDSKEGHVNVSVASTRLTGPVALAATAIGDSRRRVSEALSDEG